MKDKLFIVLQYVIPQHLLSRLVGLLAECQLVGLKNLLIKAFAKRYQVDMSEALIEDLTEYSTFNAFFTRALKPAARPIDAAPNSIVMPADGSISQLGDIDDGRIFQAKGQLYSTTELLGGDNALAAEFAQGDFATIYLSPKDYHRVHMPLAGKLRLMKTIPGDLFSVNEVTAENVPRLFARNERVVCIFDTSAGPMAVILVGAMIVAGIETAWAGTQAPLKRRISTTHYGDATPARIELAKGEEMGRFKLGSTAIVLFAKDQAQWEPDLTAGAATKMGEVLGRLSQHS
ncbi:archaetidylserine decarboxylase [Gilvimarinus sp. SDUM040013]|uniref:Phosphatidylserine decarboxylase proenzyme n=1 Tax=Gilvimarinus gilvus TaxID=3058038 RepID=A0ABU4RY78_9GAMM|nr:archaetidylserine decarboxylase [Gilvimarinus sp. SDUM040013]MDO3387377.1 archaetidylserine decarboxylase [Gilvimarinus sp. SDUM040013]MDX6849854.1 archaetidylserine decarboxylase [Gilvimarinus sp. SDUM040013]